MDVLKHCQVWHSLRDTGDEPECCSVNDLYFGQILVNGGRLNPTVSKADCTHQVGCHYGGEHFYAVIPGGQRTCGRLYCLI
jgi:hypothetical protein